MRSTLDCHALVVGINDYQSGITPLQSAARDAEAVSRLLASEHGYQVRSLIDAEATAAAILDGLEKAIEALAEDSSFLLYFAGHGIAIGDGSEGPKGFLLAQDARPTDDASWLSMDAVRHALERLPCRHLLVVLDCCFAGSFRWSSSRDAMLVSHPLYDSQFARYLDGQAWQALTSASYDQRAADTLPGRRNTRDNSASDGHSPFASALLRGLSGSADSARAQHPPDGVITATELYQYLFDELMPANAPAQQTPGLWPMRPSNVGEFVFFNPKVALNTLPDPPLDDQNNPWLGLRAYGAADKSLFFGRQRVVDALVARANEPALSLLVVVGASGTGKSSVVKAGLLPALVESALVRDADNLLVETVPRWQIVQVPRLRGDPSVQLGQALATLPAASEGGRHLLLIDQFEELYTQCHDPALRQRFLLELRALVDRADGPLVVLTLRSDFEPRLANSDQFSTLLPTARFLVPTFNTEEMRQIIEAPLSAKAMFFDPPELVDKLLDEVAAMPGALPLLSFALAEMYRQAQRRRRQTGSADRALSEDDYLKTGGVVGALHRRASALYDDADADLKVTIRRVFMRMVLQEGPRVTRRRVNLVELEYPDPAEQARVTRVLDDYVGARLLVVDEQFIEPAHDTLVVAWELLQEWLAASTAQTVMRSLWRAARDWDAAARPSGLLWNDDPRLPQVKALSAELNTLEGRFVGTSARRKTNRRRLLEFITLVIIGLLSYAAIYSMQRADEALKQTGIAEHQLAQSRRSEGLALLAVARQTLAANDYFVAAANVAKAIGYRHFGVPVNIGADVSADALADDAAELPARLLDPSQAEYVDAITELTRSNLGTLRPVAWRELDRAAVGADGKVLAGGNGEGVIEVRDFAADILVKLEAPPGQLRMLAVSDDGLRMAAVFTESGKPQRVALWRADTGWKQATREAIDLPIDNEILSITFDRSGKRLAAAMSKDIVLWDLATSTTSVRWLALGESQGVSRRTSLAFAADGDALLSGGFHNRLTRYPLPAATAPVSPRDAASPLRVRGMALGPEWALWLENVQKGDYVNAVEVSRRGDFIALASANQILVGTIDGASISFANQPVYRVRNQILDLALSSDGRLLAFNDGDTVHLLRFPSLELAGVLRPLTFRASQTASLQFLDSSGMLMLGGPGQVELIDVSGLLGKGIKLGRNGIPDPLEPARQGQKLRALIEGGQLDPMVLAFPKPDQRPSGVTWEIVEDYHEDGLNVAFSEPQPNAEATDRGSIQLRLQPGSGAQVAVGISKFDIQNLGTSDSAIIELFNVADHALVFRKLLSDEEWGLDRLRYSDDGKRLFVEVSNFDGGIFEEYAFPTTQPDLLSYLNETTCQAPINLPADRLLATTTLLGCEPPPVHAEPTTQ